MKKITVSFNGKDFPFTYYATTINNQNIYFVQSSDKHGIRLMVLDHFFITMDVESSGLFYLNAIEAGEREAAFKRAVSEAILLADLKRQPSSFSGN